MAIVFPTARDVDAALFVGPASLAATLRDRDVDTLCSGIADFPRYIISDGTAQSLISAGGTIWGFSADVPERLLGRDFDYIIRVRESEFSSPLEFDLAMVTEAHGYNVGRWRLIPSSIRPRRPSVAKRAGCAAIRIMDYLEEHDTGIVLCGMHPSAKAHIRDTLARIIREEVAR